MNKKIKALIVGGAVLVVLIGVLVTLLLLNQDSGEESSGSSTASSINLLEKNINDVTMLTVKNSKGEIVMHQSEDNTFTVEGLKDLPTDQSTVKEAFSSMAVIDATKVVSESPEKLDEYGLETPRATVQATMKDGSTHTLKVGVQSPLKDGYYGMLEGDSELYLFKTIPYADFCTVSSKDYLAKTLIANTDGKEVEELVQKISLYRSDIGHEIVFEQLENDKEQHYSPMYASAFVMTAPVKAYVDSTYFGDVSDDATSFSATSVVSVFPSEEQLKEYGFDNPSAIYTVDRKDGTRIQIKVGKACYSDPTTDDKAGTSITGYYVQLVGRDAVYYIKEAQMPFMTISVFDIISQISFAPDITTLDTLTVSAEGKEYVIDFTQTKVDTKVNNSGIEVTGTINGKSVDKDRLANFYIFVVSGLANEIYTGTPSGSPLLTLNFKFNDASLAPLEVTFHDVGDRKASITINGETRFTTRLSYVNAFFENMKAIAQDKDINLNY